MTQEFDFNKVLEQLRPGEGGVLTPLIKRLTEAALKAELEQHLESATEPNRKNAHTKKTVKSSVGEFELKTQDTALVLLKHKRLRKIKLSSPAKLTGKYSQCSRWHELLRHA